MRGARTECGLRCWARNRPLIRRRRRWTELYRYFLGGPGGCNEPLEITREGSSTIRKFLQAKLDDPRKQVDLGVVAGFWCSALRNFSAAGLGVRRSLLPLFRRLGMALLLWRAEWE